MKRCLPVFMVIALLLGACTAPAAPSGKLYVTVSILPQVWFIHQLGGDLIEVQAMVGTGDDPHTYEPTAVQMRNLGNSSLYFSIGMEYEAAWISRFKAANPNMQIVDSIAGIQRYPESVSLNANFDTPAASEAQGEPDPHVWFSVKLVKQMAANMAEALSAADPDHQQIYASNLSVLQTELDNLDLQIRSILKGVTRDHFLVAHPGWAYFAQDYGLVEMAVETGGQEPGPRGLADLLDTARKYQVTELFVQKNINSKLAQSVANQLGIQTVIEWDPLAENWIESMLKTANDLALALR